MLDGWEVRLYTITPYLFIIFSSTLANGDLVWKMDEGRRKPASQQWHY